jgi:hypothetical protein
VYTKRIENLIKGSAGNNGKCTTPGKSCSLAGVVSSADQVVRAYFQDTIAHEASHALALAPTYNQALGGNHYYTADKVVMSQTVWYDATLNPIPFALPNVYNANDASRALLK